MKYLLEVSAFLALSGVPGQRAIAVGQRDDGSLRVRLWLDEVREATLELLRDETAYWHDLPPYARLSWDVEVGRPSHEDDREHSFLLFLSADQDVPDLERFPSWLPNPGSMRRAVLQEGDWAMATVVAARAFLGRISPEVDTVSVGVLGASLGIRVRSHPLSPRSRDLITAALDDLSSVGFEVSPQFVDAAREARGAQLASHRTFFARPPREAY